MAANGGTWKKGQSGNPGGRPKKIQPLIELAQEHSESAIKRLAKVMNDDNAPHAAQVAAARALLGKVLPDMRSVEMSGSLTTKYESLTDEQLNAMIAERLSGSTGEDT